MPAYLVKINRKGGRSLKDNVDAFVVFADDTTTARETVASLYAMGSKAGILDTSKTTVFEIAAGNDFEGFKLRVAILDSTPVVDLTVVGAAAATIDSIAALMVTALNNESIIAGAAYVSPNLTIANIADALGDRTVLVELLPPDALAIGGAVEDPQPLTSMVGTITDQGIVGAALAVALVPASNPIAVYGRLKNVL